MSIDQIISSGLLELYVMGDLSPAELAIVEKAMKEDESVRMSLKIEKTLEAYAFKSTLCRMLFLPSNVISHCKLYWPLKEWWSPWQSSHSQSLIENYWLFAMVRAADMQEPEEYDSMYGRIINCMRCRQPWLFGSRCFDQTHTDEFE